MIKVKFKKDLFKWKNLYWLDEEYDNANITIEQFYDKFLH